MFLNNQVISLLVPIASITWIVFGSIQVKSKRISKLQLILFFITGLMICVLAAYRDGYGFSESAVISLSSYWSIILSILGFMIIISTCIGLICQNIIRFKLFLFISVLFVLKLSLVELIIRGIIL